MPITEMIRSLIGTRHGRFSIIGVVDKDARHPLPRYVCVCDCGNRRLVNVYNVRRGHSLSCGCFARENSSGVHTRHGMSRSKEYRAWASMLGRCHRPTHPTFKWYGARGIIVCDRWRACFENFLADMGMSPSPVHEIGRIHNSGDYSPENCRWATRKEQQNNRRSNRFIEYGGRSMTLSAWAEELGIRRETLTRRLGFYGWSVERAFTEPVHEQGSTKRIG